MSKILFIIPLLLLSVPALAQEKCELPLSAAPDIFGFRLGMSPADARRASGEKFGIRNKPESVYFQNYIKKKPPAALTGVRAVYLGFFDSKLYRIEFFYEKEAGETSLTELVDDLSAKEDLPRGFWKIEYGIAALNCGGFSVVADNFLNPRIEVTDPLGLAEFERSQKEKKKQKSEKAKN